MVRAFTITLLCWLLAGHVLLGQTTTTLFFLSDTQEPMWAETLVLKTDNNKEATAALFSDILHHDFATLFLLGDMVSSNTQENWQYIDDFVSAVRREEIPVYAIPGNHEYMMKKSSGRKSFTARFGYQATIGSAYTIDSVSVVLLNSNVKTLSSKEKQRQMKWYTHTLDSLERDNGTKTIIVCTHHSPYTNSTVVSPSKEVVNRYVPKFLRTDKAQLFLSGHSHNLEYFKHAGKHFMVIGGGGGLHQSLHTNKKQLYEDALSPAEKLRFFYLMVERDKNKLLLTVRGFASGNDLQNIETKSVAVIDL